MINQSLEPTESTGQVVNRGRSLSRAWWLIAAMIAIWLAVVLSRHSIRVHWWAYRLQTASSDADRLIYLSLLVSAGDRAIPVILPLLAHEDAGVRSMAVAALHHSRSEDAHKGLITASRDPDRDVRRLAIQGFAVHGEPRSVTELGRLMKQSDQRTAMIAAAALSAIHSGRAVEVLTAGLTSSTHAGVRIESILALASMPAVEAVPALIEAVEDDTVFDGVTEADIYAASVFGAVRDRLTDELGFGEQANLRVANRYVVGEVAEQALYAITDRPRKDDRQQNLSRPEVARQWRRWWEKASKGRTSPKPG